MMYPARLSFDVCNNSTYLNQLCAQVNATALAVPRVLLAVMENYQNEVSQIMQPPHHKGSIAHYCITGCKLTVALCL